MYGTDVFILARQMGTSVEMIEDYYGHVEPVKNPDLILKGIPGWETPEGTGEEASGVNAHTAGGKAKPGKAKRQGKALPTAGKASRSTRRH
jgi:integrase